VFTKKGKREEQPMPETTTAFSLGMPSSHSEAATASTMEK